MVFNYLAIALAALAAWIIGAAWYGVLGEPWMRAQGFSEEKIAACKTEKKKMPAGLLAFTYVAELVMAVGLSCIMNGMGGLTIQNGVAAGAGAWLAFVISTMAVNHGFQGQKKALTIIDGGMWLVALVVEGAVLGAFGA